MFAEVAERTGGQNISTEALPISTRGEALVPPSYPGCGRARCVPRLWFAVASALARIWCGARRMRWRASAVLLTLVGREGMVVGSRK